MLVKHDGSTHHPEPVPSEQCMEVDLREPESSGSGSGSPTAAGSSLHGAADLMVHPCQTKIFTLSSLSRTAGDVQVQSVTLSVAADAFNVDYIVPLEHDRQPGEWWTKTGNTVKKHRLNRERISSVKILPRPPKMQLRLLDLAGQYYTDEQVTVMVEVTNGEHEDTESSLEARILGEVDPLPQITSDDDDQSDRDPSSNDGAAQSDQSRPSHSIGRLRPSEKVTRKLSFTPASYPVQYVLEIKVLYHQLSEPDTPISKTIARPLPVVAPFDASYNFSPRLHEAAWPSYFDMPDTFEPQAEEHSAKTASGLIQRWALSTGLTSLAAEQLLVDSLELQTLAVNGDVICSISEAHDSTVLPAEIFPQSTQQHRFILDAQKLSLDDRRSATLDMALVIHWKRSTKASSTTTTTTLHVPRLLVHGGEPRILAVVQYSSIIPGLIHLEYTLENPSLRLLTLTMVMEMSEDFAFYGPKAGTLQLVPISRHTVRFNLYPTVRETWIQPQLKVLDRYFNKTLRVTATEGMRMDKIGILVWVNADG